MKILRVISNMDPAHGGPCQGIRNSIPELMKLGAINEVVSLDDPNASYLGKDNFSIHALGPAKGPWAYGEKLYPWLIENIVNYDVVIIHGLWLYHGFAVLKAIKKLRKQQTAKVPKFFVMPHGMLDPYFQKAEGRRLKAIRNWFFWKLIESNLVNKADGILFTCEQELQLARLPFRPYSPKSELNVGYGVPSPPPFEEEMKRAFEEKALAVKGEPYILFLSRIHPKKGIDLLIDAFQKILFGNETKVESIPKLIIAGPGAETEFGKTLQEKVKACTLLSKKVIFTGMLVGDSKWGAFYGCKAFILPSHQENFGIAVAEALAAGKPVLISKQVNIWREIYAGGAGLVEEDSINGTISLLERFFSLSETEVAKMGDAATKVFEAHFAIAPAAHNMLKLIKQQF
jgi:glycosyltransferase involved in cell wall biosynthesis